MQTICQSYQNHSKNVKIQFSQQQNENIWGLFASCGFRLVPGLKNMPVPVLLTHKIRYTNKTAPVQRPFLLAGEIGSPAGRVLRVSSTGMFFRPGTNLK